MSATLTATALRPTLRASDQSRRKCTPSTSTSIDVSTGGSQVEHRGIVARADQDIRSLAGRPAVIAAISANSPTSPGSDRRGDHGDVVIRGTLTEGA